MSLYSTKSFAFAALPAFAAFLLVQACGGSGSATAQELAADPIEGVWESVITGRDCASSAPTGTFIGAQVFHRGGTLSDTNASPTATRGPGFGTWVKSGETYTARFRFYTYGPTGSVSGVNRVTRTITLAASGDSATSVNTSQAYDMTGAPTTSTCATDVSTRVL